MINYIDKNFNFINTSRNRFIYQIDNFSEYIVLHINDDHVYISLRYSSKGNYNKRKISKICKECDEIMTFFEEHNYDPKPI